MNADLQEKTIEAIKKSIIRWEKVVNTPFEEFYAQCNNGVPLLPDYAQCALCQLYGVGGNERVYSDVTIYPELAETTSIHPAAAELTHTYIPM